MGMHEGAWLNTGIIDPAHTSVHGPVPQLIVVPPLQPPPVHVTVHGPSLQSMTVPFAHPPSLQMTLQASLGGQWMTLPLQKPFGLGPITGPPQVISQFIGPWPTFE
jgi:hypothetical protein